MCRMTRSFIKSSLVFDGTAVLWKWSYWKLIQKRSVFPCFPFIHVLETHNYLNIVYITVICTQPVCKLSLKFQSSSSIFSMEITRKYEFLLIKKKKKKFNSGDIIDEPHMKWKQRYSVVFSKWKSFTKYVWILSYTHILCLFMVKKKIFRHPH